MGDCTPTLQSNREWVFVFLDSGVIENGCLYY